MPAEQELAAALEAVRDDIRSASTEIDRTGRIPEPALSRLREAGLFRVAIPERWGGLELAPPSYLRLCEQAGRINGSLGWCVMIGAGNPYTCLPYLPDETVGEIFARDVMVITGGKLSPEGRAMAVDGGYRFSGRWSYNSGCLHSSWLVGAAILTEDGKPVAGPSGGPQLVYAIFPAEEVQIIETWDTTGLRGTGSHDFVVEDVFVPSRRTYSLFDSPVLQESAIYRYRFLFTGAVAAPALGIAAAAVEAFGSLASKKTAAGASSSIAGDGVIQLEFAKATALLDAARLLYFDAAQKCWDEMQAGGEPAVLTRARWRMAAANAMESAVRCTDMIYGLAGGTAVYKAEPFDRLFRDVHTAAAHIAVGRGVWQAVGRAYLGLDPGPRF